MNDYKIKRLSYIEFDHEPTPDELMHFKYIKREKVNGKWRYWYDTNGLKNDIADKLGYDELEEYRKASSIAESTNQEWKKNHDKANHFFEQYLRLKEQGFDDQSSLDISKSYSEKAGRASVWANWYSAELYKAQEALYKTPIGKLLKTKREIREKIDTGASYVKKILGKKHQ